MTITFQHSWICRLRALPFLAGRRPILSAALALPLALAACSDPGTGALESDDTTVSPTYAAYAGLARRHGVTPSPDRPLVVGVRGQSTAGTAHPTLVGHAFDDRLVLTTDRRVLPLAMSTHPFETRGAPGSGIPDVDHNHVPDVGMIEPGVYVAKRRDPSRNIVGETTYQVFTAAGSDHIPGFRNTDHDSSYSDAERAASAARRDTLTDILFHVGGEGAPAVVGCQVLSAPDMHTLAAEGGARFDYLLVDAHDEEVPQP